MTLNTKPIESGMSDLRERVIETVYNVLGERISDNIANEIISLCMDECIEAINQKPFDMSSTEFPYKREHQEEGLNLAIKAVNALKTTDSK